MAEEEDKGEEIAPVDGERVKLGDKKWPKVLPKTGQVMELEVWVSKGPGLTDEGIKCALIVTDVEFMKDSGVVIQGRCIGASDEDYLKVLQLEVNRRRKGVHLCMGDPCLAALENVACHTSAVTMWEPGAFTAPYVKAWGAYVLKESIELGVRVAPRRPLRADKEPKPGGRKRPAADVERSGVKVRKRKKDRGKGLGGTPPEKPAGNSQLAARLESVKQTLLGQRNTPVIDLEAKEDESAGGPGEDEEDSYSAEEETEERVVPKEERRLSTGDHLNPRRSMLALTDGPWEEATRGDTSRRRRRSSTGKQASLRHPAQQLLAVAAVQGGNLSSRKSQRKRREREQGRKEKDGGDRYPHKKKKEEKRKKKKQKKVKKEKVKRKKKRPGGSSDGSSSSDSGDSCPSSESSSESSSLLAPLQRKSREEPGAVLSMLVKHARETLDQSALVDTEESKDITRGVKLSSYFALMLRPYYSTTSRDMKELFHLANCVDQLRSGQLGLLGDSLASRFLAIHCAMVEGTWKSAQYLELNPLDAPTSAPATVLLDAKRHAKLIYKSQLNNDGGRRGSDWDWQGGEWQKGKSKGKGKGRGKGKNGAGRGGWGNSQGSSWWDYNKDKKDGKDAKEGGDGEKKKK